MRRFIALHSYFIAPHSCSSSSGLLTLRRRRKEAAAAQRSWLEVDSLEGGVVGVIGV